MSISIRERIWYEVKGIMEKSLYYAEANYAAETPWYRLYYLLGISSSVIAAASGVAAFSKLASEVVGITSIVAAILVALLTLLDPNKKANIHHNAATSYEALYNDSHNFLATQIFTNLTDNQLNEKLDVLMSRLNQLNDTKLSLTGYAHKTARKNVDGNDGEVRRIDKEDDIVNRGYIDTNTSETENHPETGKIEQDKN